MLLYLRDDLIPRTVAHVLHRTTPRPCEWPFFLAALGPTSKNKISTCAHTWSRLLTYIPCGNAIYLEGTIMIWWGTKSSRTMVGNDVDLQGLHPRTHFATRCWFHVRYTPSADVTEDLLRTPCRLYINGEKSFVSSYRHVQIQISRSDAMRKFGQAVPYPNSYR